MAYNKNVSSYSSGSPKWVNEAAFLLEALGKNFFPCPCWLLQAVCSPWLIIRAPILKANSTAPTTVSASSHPHITFSL